MPVISKAAVADGHVVSLATSAVPAFDRSRGGAAATHVAIIMDGNGRWASARGLPRIAGHREGARAVRRTIEAAIRAGVSWLTIYAFSSENWRRPAGEIIDLTGLLRRYLQTEIAELKESGVRLRFIGERDRFDPDIQRDLAKAEADTRTNTRLNLTIALSYGARAEIAAAARAAIAAVQDGTLKPEDLTEDRFAGFLTTHDTPDPDLIIRTSGEQRLSNFLLWQAAYAEFVFLDVLWPDFDATHFDAALAEYARRERRFGARAG
ncbi:MAG TPA: polyprenyl diphosphate synthase [Rhodopila sp.]|uniref:polyprenyl diphosphate synthase n=1 Tax=Rhodopila sp. TaxID=2480087 RepID=UPI002CC644EA|nr:polyprenyl diphosphate synthase [Rhodopila sp.]HVY18318.1 polyprenyl diphosphate synthase [Rhodopila sp.]